MYHGFNLSPNPRFTADTLSQANAIVSTIHATLTDTTFPNDPIVDRQFLLECSQVITRQAMLIDGLATENRRLNENLATFTERLLKE